MAAHVMNLIPAAVAQPAGHVRPLEWLLFIIPMAALFGLAGFFFGTGESGGGSVIAMPLRRLNSSLRRATGLPGWAAGGIIFGEWSLLMAALGFYWDVAWHIDFGRDKVLFTPPHMMILIGLMGVLGSAILSIALASVEGARVGVRLGRLRIPYGALPLLGLGLFATAGFPLDDLWHRTYGIDVTMWSPTHLMMIGGACFSPLALRLLLVEAGPSALETKFGRIVRRGLTGAILVALSAFQLEFDLGVPQWQMLYQPVLIMGSAAIVFVVARESLGRGGALVVWVNYLVLRLFWWAMVGPVLGHVSPHFPLYLGAALIVEAVWMFGARLQPLARALTAGALIGTAGLATEWGWSLVWAKHPWQATMFPGIWAAVMIALAGAVLGLAVGSILSFRRPPVGAATLVLATLGVVGAMVVPFPRHASDVTAALTVTPASEPQQAVDRNGLPTVVRDYNVALQLQPADATRNVDYFSILSWQGGKARLTPLIEDGPGRYHAANPVPTGGTWKTAVFLQSRDVLDALPISMPADSDYGIQAIRVQSRASAHFVPAEQVLMAESHAGSTVPKLLALTGFFGELAVTALFFLVAFIGLSRRFGEGEPRQGRRAGSREMRRAATAS
ncbi:MAG: hypothetical protein QOK05_217 [Chloroflexota bacterium]|jgi:hypothetical protein|nr:hypothetical protein [Chloroflexota bacterium]